jgi:hypothetical protein
MKPPKERPKTVSERLKDLFKSNPSAKEWSTTRLAEELGVNKSSIKRSATWSLHMEERPHFAAKNHSHELTILILAEVRRIPGCNSIAIARRIGRTQSWCRSRATALVSRGLLDSRVGGSATGGAGYWITLKGEELLSKSV